MFCTLCEKHGKGGPWVSGTDNFRVKTIERHLNSNEHKEAMTAQAPDQQVLPSTFTASMQRRHRAIVSALRTVYWIVTEEIANRKYASLLKLLNLQGCTDVQNLRIGGNASYNSPDIFNQLLAALNEVIENENDSKVRASPCIGVGIDESTDRSNEKHIVVVVRYIDLVSAKLMTTFLKCKEVNDCSAAGIYNVMTEILRDKNIPMTKVCGLGTDGASVMTGHLNGVTAQIHEDNPHCICTHCVCHRLALAVSQACKDIPIMQSLIAVISAIYNFVSHSPRRAQQLKDLNDLLEQKNIKLKRLYEICWLSMGESVTAIINDYEALLLLTSQEAAEGDPVAIGLNQQLSSYLYLALLHLTADVLSATNHLSKLWQYRDVCFSAVHRELDDCIETLEELRDNNGIMMVSMLDDLNADPIDTFKGAQITFAARRGQANQRVLFDQTRRQFLDELLMNIRARFPQVQLLTAMQIFEPASYPAERRQLIGWGNEHLQTLLGHYGQPAHTRAHREFPPVADANGCREEFLPFKRLVHDHLGDQRPDSDGVVHWHFYRPPELLQRIFGDNMQGNQALFPCMFKLMALSLCVMVGNAEAERVFSCQNRIKTKARTLLTISQLDKLIRLSYMGIPIEDIDYEAARVIFDQRPRRI